MSQAVARRLLVKGRVQGVGFRYFVYRAASQLGVRGWVRNLPDGSVEIHAEGPLSWQQALLERVRTGPPLSRVVEVTCDPAERQDLAGFDIRY